METEIEPVNELESKSMISTCPISLDDYLSDDVTFKGIHNRELSSALYMFENMDEKNEKKKVEPISAKELSTSRALVPVTPEIKFHNIKLGVQENGVLFPNDLQLNFMSFVNLKFDKTIVQDNLMSDSKRTMVLDFNKRNDRKMRVRISAREKRRILRFDNLVQLPKKSEIQEQSMCLAWGKCKTRIQEHRMRLAASTNNVETVEQLLNAGISPNNQDFRGRSPLHLSACRGYTEIVRILLQYNADPNRQDCIGNTPLHLATLTNRVPVVTLLLEAGAKVNTLDFRGFTPLYLAQTKLRLMQMRKCDDMTEVEKQMFEIVNMLRVYLKKLPSNNESSNWNAQMEKINDICSKLSLSATSKTVEVHDEVRTLLSSIEALNLS